MRLRGKTRNGSCRHQAPLHRWRSSAVRGAAWSRCRRVTAVKNCRARLATEQRFLVARGGQMHEMPQAAGGTGIVIVGGAMAGGNAAVTLREEGFRDRVTLIGRETGIPFGRPPLSKT